MKQIYYSYIPLLNSKKKAPPLSDYIQKHGIKILLSVNRPASDSVIMLTSDFDFNHMKRTYGDSVNERPYLDWEFFYRHCPEETLSIMKENGICYIEMVARIEKEKKDRREFQELMKNWVVTGIEDLTVIPK